MIRRILLLVPAALLVLALAAPGLAQSAGQRACEADGGEWTRVGPGQYECVHTEETPAPVNQGQGNKPKTIEDETIQPQQGQGVGGGAKGEETQLTCVYNQNDKLQTSKSDEGCPPTR